MQLRHKCLLPYKRSWKLIKAFKFCMLKFEMAGEVGSVPAESHSMKKHGLGSP